MSGEFWAASFAVSQRVQRNWGLRVVTTTRTGFNSLPLSEYSGMVHAGGLNTAPSLNSLSLSEHSETAALGTPVITSTRYQFAVS